MEHEDLERAIEAILFAAGERVELSRLAFAADVTPEEAEAAANALADRYAFERRGIRILRLEDGYQMVSSGEMADYVTKALETEAFFFSAGSAGDYRVLSACHQGNGGADPRRGQRLFHFRSAE